MHTHTHTRRPFHTDRVDKKYKKKKERKIEILLYLFDRLLVTGHVCGCYQIALPSMPQWPIDTTNMACLLHSVLEPADSYLGKSSCERETLQDSEKLE